MKKLVKLIIKIDKWLSDTVWDMYPELTKHMKKK